VLLDHRPDTMQRACQVGAERQGNRHRAVAVVAVPQTVPRQRQLAQTLHVAARLPGDDGAGGGLAVGGADAEDTLAAAQLADPLAVALEVALAGVAQAARVRVHPAEHRPPAVGPAGAWGRPTPGPP